MSASFVGLISVPVVVCELKLEIDEEVEDDGEGASCRKDSMKL
jgi:hypothetical protein